jgi:hypothetical protein
MKCAICEEREESFDVGGTICYECWREGYNCEDGHDIRLGYKTVEQVKQMMQIFKRQQEQEK